MRVDSGPATPSFRPTSMGDPGPVSESLNESALKALEARLSQARARVEPEKPHMEEHYSQAHLAWRMVIELVAGLGIGFGIGYGLDSLLGTRPWLMVVFTLLGFVAGVKTMIRSAQEVQRKNEAARPRGTTRKGPEFWRRKAPIPPRPQRPATAAWSPTG
jgi:ATP synthase protein I